jgi:peptidyl-dipeptidase Dcp
MSAESNPLLATWSTPFGLPPFDAIAPGHFGPAIEAGIAAQVSALNAIAADPAPPSFENTILAFERSGQLLGRVVAVFSNLTYACATPELQGVEAALMPVLAMHGAAVYQNPALYARIDAVYAGRDALGPVERRLVERFHLDFQRAGAHLGAVERGRLADIGGRLASLFTAFAQRVMADEAAWVLWLDPASDLDGLPEFARADCAAAAEAHGRPGGYAVTLARSAVESFLTFSRRRGLREAVWRAWVARGGRGDAHDTHALAAEILALRAERAAILGYPSFAHYKLDDTMARTPAAARALLDAVWAPALARAGREEAALTARLRADGLDGPLCGWDWRFYAEQERKAAYDLDESELKPYFQLDTVLEAAFDVAERLFGVRFRPAPGLPVHHPDVRAFEVQRVEGGAHVGVFLHDPFARAGKRAGAWMSTFRDQQALDGEVRPIVINTCNFSRPAPGQPCLLSVSDAETLFHELGHGLHGLLSEVVYPSFAGTAVLQDFVELPSQIYEHWLLEPAVLRRFARHAATGEAIPEALIERLRAARTFNQGFATVEFLGSALVDLRFHLLSAEEARAVAPAALEAAELARIGMPAAIGMRHRTPHFLHLFSSDGYAAGYYSYLWAEVLDADGFDAFVEAGDAFDPALAARLHRFIYAAGGTQAPMDAYIAFRGRAPEIGALLRHRGLAPA